MTHNNYNDKKHLKQSFRVTTADTRERIPVPCGEPIEDQRNRQTRGVTGRVSPTDDPTVPGRDEPRSNLVYILSSSP